MFDTVLYFIIVGRYNTSALSSWPAECDAKALHIATLWIHVSRFVILLLLLLVVLTISAMKIIHCILIILLIWGLN